MRFLLALTAAVSLAACSHNKTTVDTAPEKGTAATDTVRTTGKATGTATGTVSDTATGTAKGTATGAATSTTNTSADTVRSTPPDSL